jgi:riboflavin synthase alpha subunit
VIGAYRRGVAVNIEVDIIARYLERLSFGAEASSQPLLETLKKHGFT